MKNFTFILGLLMLTCYPTVFAQSAALSFPVIGEKAPEWIFKTHSGQSRNIAKPNGKYLIIDFWAEGCVSCIKSFPKLSALQNIYKADVDILVVGKLNENIANIYEKYEAKFNLKLTSVYDSTVFRAFKINGVPTSIWIDKTGTVKAITSSVNITGANIEKFTSDRELDLLDVSYTRFERDKKQYNYKIPFQVQGNGGADGDFITRSMLSEWKPEMSMGGQTSISFKSSKFEILRTRISGLFRIAYSGSELLPEGFYGKIVYETNDPIIIADSKATDTVSEGYYCYSLIYPPREASFQKTQKLMQEDLKRYFNTIAVVEERDMPCWYFSVVDSTKFKQIKTKGGKQGFEENATSLSVVNTPPKIVADFLASILFDTDRIYSTIPEQEHLDFNLNALMYDAASVRAALRQIGLDLIPGKKNQKVVVLKSAAN